MKSYMKPNLFVLTCCPKDVIASSNEINARDGYVPDPENVANSLDF